MDTVRTDKATTDKLTDNNTNDSAIEIKGSVFTLPVLKICTTQVQEIEHSLKTHLAQSLSFFKNAPIVIDLERTHDQNPDLDFSALIKILRQQQLVPVAVQKGRLEQHMEAEKAGLAILTGQSGGKARKETVEAVVDDDVEVDSVDIATPSSINNQQITSTKMVTQPIRSGQRIYARDGDLIILAAVNAGAEVMADGNIHIYAPLRGRALAGVQGNQEARIFCHCMEAELIAIAGSYRFFEDDVPKEIHQKSVQIRLRGEQLDIVPIQ